MKRYLRIERLARREEKATIRRTLYLSIFSVILAVLFFVAGIPTFGKFADFVSSAFKKSADTGQDTGVPQAPILDDLPSATNSARLVVKGFSGEGKKVEIYLNEGKVSAVDVSDNHFEFADLNLKKGENTISARSVSESGKTSGASDSKKVIYDIEEPKLEIDTPSDGQAFSGNNRIKVSGKTDPDAQVYANGFLASVDFGGKFDVLIPVGEGETTIEIKAVDQAGNNKVEKRKVNFHK